MKLIESASQAKGRKMSYKFDSGHRLSLERYNDGTMSGYITLPNSKRAAHITYWKKLYMTMQAAILKGIE